MKITRHKLNHADGVNLDAYSFGTLWQEITNGVGHITTSIVNGLQVTERTKQLREYFSLKKEEDRHDYLKTLAYGGQKSDAGFYIIIVLIVLALGGGLIFALKYKKKQ